MPYNIQWEPNELFLEHNGIRIFHTYRDDEDQIRQYQFGTSSNTCDDGDPTAFDVRDLPTWALLGKETSAVDHGGRTEGTLQEEWEKLNRGDVTGDAIRKVIISAIDAGHLKEYIDAAADRSKETAAAEEEDPSHIEKLETLIEEMGSIIRRLDEEANYCEYWLLDGNENGPDYVPALEYL